MRLNIPSWLVKEQEPADQGSGGSAGRGDIEDQLAHGQHGDESSGDSALALPSVNNAFETPAAWDLQRRHSIPQE